jgi:Txe/YoeB family toxin of toxin-antitoxin system
MNYKIELTKLAQKDLRNLKSAGLEEKAKKIRNVLQLDPYPNISKELLGDLAGKRSIRINLKHRLVYEVLEEEKIIKILSMWRHYE